MAVVLLLACAAAHAADLPRIAVGGGLRLGFGGVLLRAGLPFDYLSDREQCDLSVLGGYDLVLMADMDDRLEPWQPDALAALDEYVRLGGRLLNEAGNRLPRAMEGWRVRTIWLHLPHGRDHRDFALLPAARGHDAAFFSRLPAERSWTFSGTVHPLELTDGETKVWARFTRGPARGRPAVLHRSYGRGEIITLGAALSYQQGNWDPLYEDLILACVNRLTNGRATAQWAAEPAPVEPPAPAEPPAAASAPEGFSDLGEAPADGYAIRLPRSAELSLEHTAAGDLQLTVTANHLSLMARDPGNGRTILACSLPPAGQLVFYRGSREAKVLADGVVLAATPMDRAPAGGCSARQTDGVLFQPLEALWFTDDFTRQGALDQPWQRLRGTWLLGGTNRPESTIPGFALRGWDGTVRCGEWFWSDYEAAVSVRPRGARMVRLRVAAWDGGHCLELALPVGLGREGVVNRFAGGPPVRLCGGVPNLPEQQWTRIAVSFDGGRARVTVGGVTLPAFDAPEVGCGGVELCVDHGDALFDDVQVASHTGESLRRIHPLRYDKGPDGLLDRDTWSHPAAAWLPQPERGVFRHVGRFNRSFSFRLPVHPNGAPARLQVAAVPERGDAAPLASFTGDELRDGDLLRVDWRPGQAEWRLSNAAGSGPPHRVAAPSGSVGLQLSFAGLKLAAGDLDVRSAEVEEWVFDHALCETWETQGEWSVGSRWPCMTQWSWLIGVGSPVAALWSRKSYDGRKSALVVQALLGVRMSGLYADRAGEPLERLRLTIAGDGQNPRSGYWLDLGGGPDGYSRLYRRTAKRDVVVASAARHLSYPREIHNSWQDVRVEWVRPTIRVYCQRRLLLEYTDPAPLDGGQFCLWTENNALVTPYVAVYGDGSAERTNLSGDLQKKRLEELRNHLARPGFDALPLLRVLSRLLHRELYSP